MPPGRRPARLDAPAGLGVEFDHPAAGKGQRQQGVPAQRKEDRDHDRQGAGRGCRSAPSRTPVIETQKKPAFGLSSMMASSAANPPAAHPLSEGG